MNENSPIIGVARTALVFKEAGAEGITAVVTSISAKTLDPEGAERLCFLGPVRFDQAVVERAKEIVLPLVDDILDALGIARRGFQVSVANLNAASAQDLKVRISGHSADAPLFLAMLSTGLQASVAQHTLCTGHIASRAGHMAMVSAIPAKLRAALADGAVEKFMYPALDRDTSMKTLSPEERGRVEAAVITARAEMQCVGVRDIGDLAADAFSDEAVVRAALREGFFRERGKADRTADPVGRAVAFLAGNHGGRFWAALERRLFAGDADGVKELLRLRAEFHLARKTYPRKFGGKLLQLIRSLPPATRRVKIVFPLLPMETCIRWSQYAKKSDHEDVALLYDAVLGKSRGALLLKETKRAKGRKAKRDRVNAALDVILSEASAEALAHKVCAPIDEARGAYVAESVTVSDDGEFEEAVAGFYLHLVRRGGLVGESADPNAVSSAAVDLAAQAFAREGGWKAALAEAVTPTRGGLRRVFDAMADHLRSEAKRKYANWVFKAALGTLGQAEQVALMATIRERLGGHLPEDVLSISAEDLARNPELVVTAYLNCIDSFSAALRVL